jgi:hypothetical protein
MNAYIHIHANTHNFKAIIFLNGIKLFLKYAKYLEPFYETEGSLSCSEVQDLGLIYS